MNWQTDFNSFRTSVVFRLTLSLFFPLFVTQAASGAEGLPKLRPFLVKFCYECHDNDSAKGDLNLERLSTDLTNGDRMRLWTAVHDRLARGEMPPKEADQPPPADRERNRKLLARLLTDADRARHKPVLRRLNRVEYENTVRDLFDIEVFVKEMLPEDASAHGFDKIGASLSVS